MRLRIALVHYWLVSWRGGERVLEALAEIFPQADLFTHVYDPAVLPASLAGRRIQTTFIARLPGARRRYQRYLPLMPLALEALDLRGYDLVISSESGPAKGVITSPESVHVCYCHSPMRYLWDLYPEYRQGARGLTRLLMPWLAHRLRMWDVTSAARVDHFIANSRYVARRIEKYYRRSAAVIHPPVDTSLFQPSAGTDDYYLVVGQLVRYKRADLAVQACNALGRHLVVVGEGEEMRALKRLAGPTVELVGRQDADRLREHYARCRALLFPGVEDFGIVPVEAMASGRPVIAYARGGALETVREGETGIYFHEQTPEAVAEALERYESIEHRFGAATIRRYAEGFDREVFKARIKTFIDGTLALADTPGR
jgi:glycosyltransferase involved in cell wall biosynthesis